MDPISHVAFGRTLIALAGNDGRSRGIVGAAVIGSLAPDIDAAVMPLGWDRYLRVHEIGTHSLVGSLLCALLIVLAVRIRRREAPFARLLMAAWVGTISHLALDIVSGARLRVGWPMFDRYWTLPLVAMADPLLLSLLVASVVLLAVVGRHRHRAAAVVALLIVAMFLSVKGVLALNALSGYRNSPATSAAADLLAVEARWGSLRDWTFFDRSADQVRAWHAVAGQPGAALVAHWPVARPSGTAERSLALPTVRNFLRTHDLPIVTVRPTADGGVAVLWSDLRYCWNPSPSAPADDGLIARLGDGRELACGLWFGGEFGQSTGPIRQIVKIGAITQTRDPPE